MIQSVFVWLISVRSEVLVQKLFSGFEHESFEMHGVVLVTTVVGPLGIWRAHGENVQNFKASVTHGPDWVSVVKMYALKWNERYSRKQLTLNNCIQFFSSNTVKISQPLTIFWFRCCSELLLRGQPLFRTGKGLAQTAADNMRDIALYFCKIDRNNSTCLH